MQEREREREAEMMKNLFLIPTFSSVKTNHINKKWKEKRRKREDEN